MPRRAFSRAVCRSSTSRAGRPKSFPGVRADPTTSAQTPRRAVPTSARRMRAAVVARPIAVLLAEQVTRQTARRRRRTAFDGATAGFTWISAADRRPGEPSGPRRGRWRHPLQLRRHLNQPASPGRLLLATRRTLAALNTSVVAVNESMNAPAPRAPAKF